MFKRLLRTFRKRTQKPVSAVSFDPTGVSFALESPALGGSISVRWDDIETVLVYKRDCFAWDQLCLTLVTSEYEYTFTEDDAGWQALIDQLPASLPGAMPFEKWYMDVAFPAFETNMALIFDRHHPDRQGRLQ